MCYKFIFILEFFLASQLLGLGASVSKITTDTRNTMSEILSPLCFTVSFKNWCITFLLIKAFLRILYHSFARHIHILQWKLLLSEQCALTIYLLQQPSWLLTRQALEISNSLPLHKIAWGIYRMKEIRAWQILELLVSLFLKKRNAFRQALLTWTIEEHILDFKWKYCSDKILVEIPTCHPRPFVPVWSDTRGRSQDSRWKKTDPDGVRNRKCLLTYSAGSWSQLLFQSTALSVSRHAAFLTVVQRADIWVKVFLPILYLR